jgi:hypothetical protein
MLQRAILNKARDLVIIENKVEERMTIDEWK